MSDNPTSDRRVGGANRYSKTDYLASSLYAQSLDYLLGAGVAKDERRAFDLNAEAAELGYSDAILAMGWFYLSGVGVAPDCEQARRWYRDSARRSDNRAMFSLGGIAYTDDDYTEALVWFKRASDAGHYRSIY
jgi:uncharacterized protein